MKNIFGGSEFTSALAELQRQRKMPATIPPFLMEFLRNSLVQYSEKLGEETVQKIIDEFQDLIESCMCAREPKTKRGIIYDLGRYARPEMADRIRIVLETVQQVCSGMGHYLNQNISPEAVDEYPALEFKKLFRRNSKKENDWPVRWANAGANCGDLEWLPWEGDAPSGRGVALKSSGIWIGLGTNRDDTLGCPFPPFVFNSSFWTQDVSRRESEKLGLIRPHQRAYPARIGFEDLYAPINVGTTRVPLNRDAPLI